MTAPLDCNILVNWRDSCVSGDGVFVLLDEITGADMEAVPGGSVLHSRCIFQNNPLSLLEIGETIEYKQVSK